MELGLITNTHGCGGRDDTDWWHQPMPPEEMRPVESAQLAERLGFYMVSFGDHVAFPEASPESLTPVYREGRSNLEVRQRGELEGDVGSAKRHYPPKPNILDGIVVMGAIATQTSRIKMGSGVLISPYRHPLSDARQFATIDYLSNGRLLMGVGAGWMKEEFDVLGLDHGKRLQMLEECIQVYNCCWTQDFATFHGQFYDFENVVMFPKPIQTPRPPFIVGATTKPGARITARYGDALYPILVQANTRPHEYDVLQDEIRRECEKIGRDPSEIAMIGIVSARITDAKDEEATRKPRRNFGGTAEQILSDVERFADAGYSLLNLAPHAISATYQEWEEQVQRIGEEVLPQAKKIKAAGEWRQDLW